MPNQSVRQYLVPVVTALSLGLAGCLDTGSEATGDNGSSNGNVGGDAVSGDDAPLSRTTSVNFDPTNQVIPFPNNLLFEAADDAELDGTLNAPVDESDPDSAALIEGLNALNGFSTIAEWRLEFTNEVDDSSLVAGETVRVFKLETAGDTYPERTQGVAVEKELVGGEDFELRYLNGDGAGPYRIKIIPKRALAHDATYAAIITDGVRDTDGNRVASPIEWSVARGQGRLDECGNDNIDDEAFLQCMTNRAIAPVAEAANGLDRGDMIMGWGVTTQREDRTFPATVDGIKDSLEADFVGAEFLDAGSNPSDDAPRTPGGKAIVWPGTVKLPYGLNAVGHDQAGDGFEEASVELLEANLFGEDEDPQPYAQNADEDHPFLNTKWDCLTRSCDSDEALGLLDDEAGPAIPAARSVQQVPAVMATPDPEETGHEAPYPLVIFQHAIQQDRSTALAIADKLAEQGYAVMAIDMPMHGMVLNQLDLNSDSDSQRVALHASQVNLAMNAVEEGIQGDVTSDDRLPLHHERTFYTNAVDRSEYETATSGVETIGDDDTPVRFDPDVDPSGEHFLVPNNPLLQRDLMRQAALDLAMLAHYVRTPGMTEQVCIEIELSDLPWTPISDLANLIADAGCSNDSFADVINTDEIHFLGHSVANIVAAPFLAYDQEIRSASFMAPTGGIMRTLEGSETIGPVLREGLAEADLRPGDEDYYRFFNVVSAAIDPVEPLNHAEAITTRLNAEGETEDRPVYMAQIAGNDGSDGTATPSDADLVLSPTVDGWPTAGSTPLAEAMGLSHDPAGQSGDGITVGDGQTPLQTRVSFRYGDHASFLLPLDEADEPAGNVAGFPYEGEDYDSSLDPHDEMQQQIGSFLDSQGQQLEINDADKVEIQ